MEPDLRQWKDDLIRCPSQCYYYFYSKDNKPFCLYLRWRWSDPWEVYLVEFRNGLWDWDTSHFINMTLELDKEYEENELEELKKAALKMAFKKVGFSSGANKKGEN